MTMIMCRVIKVDRDATTCQTVGNCYPVDATFGENICPRAQKVVEAVADRMRAIGPGVDFLNVDYVDVACPDHHVIYRLTRVGDERATE